MGFDLDSIIGGAKGYMTDLFDPVIRKNMLGAATDLSNDSAFGRQVGSVIAGKLKGSLPAQLAGKLNNMAGLFKQSNFMEDGNFGYRIGRTIAQQDAPFTTSAAGAISDTVFNPQMALDTIDRSNLNGMGKSLLRFATTGNMFGRGGLMSDVFGKKYWNALTGNEDDVQKTG